MNVAELERIYDDAFHKKTIDLDGYAINCHRAGLLAVAQSLAHSTSPRDGYIPAVAHAEKVRMLTASLEDAEHDARRWQLARKIFTADSIREAYFDYYPFAHRTSERDHKRADEAMDQALEEERTQ